MKKILMMLALIAGTVAAYAQQSNGDYYEGLSRKIGFSRMIPPHGLEITYDKTVHIIFSLSREICGPGFAQSDSGQGGRCGKM